MVSDAVPLAAGCWRPALELELAATRACGSGGRGGGGFLRTADDDDGVAWLLLPPLESSLGDDQADMMAS